ncbi:hypothetical protein [Anabaena azotica]|uniref:hypothetical protein n=1 Tax=Anabaena azotica TaxID=197653 RepID=UPI0039A59E61
MTKSQGFLATFRIDEELWGKFKDIAKDAQTNASALLIRYIQGVVSSGGVDNSPQATPQNIDNSPKLSIQDVEKIIDEKINSSIQAMDNTPNQSIQNLEELIDSRILLSVLNGDIKDAIARSYSQATTNLNSTREEFYSKLEELTHPTHDHSEIINTARDGYNQLSQMVHDLQLQINELKGIPAPPANSLIGSSFEQSIINLVPIGRLIGAYGESPIDGSECGEIYTKKYLIENELFFHLKNHQQEVEKKLKIKLSLDNDTYAVREMNKILKALGYELGHKQINKVEHYWVVNPQK